MRYPLHVLLFALLALLAFPPPADAQAAKKDPNRLTEEEIMASTAGNALELIRTQRPHWLRTRGQRSMQGANLQRGQGGSASPTPGPNAPIPVYVDGTRFGIQDVLRDLALDEILLIEFLDHRRATTRFGTGHTHGAIVVTQRR